MVFASKPFISTAYEKIIAFVKAFPVSVNYHGKIKTANHIKLMAAAREAYFSAAHEGHRAADCVECRQCENVCPQHLPITDYLKTAAEMFPAKSRE